MSLRALRRITSRVAIAAVLTSAAGTAAVVALPAPAFASSASLESAFIADMNSARTANGLAPYSVSWELTSVARDHSARMASTQSLYHNPSLTTDISNWMAVGENVGEGPTVGDVHQAFMQSPEHRANILDHDFTQVGVGVSVDRNGIVWVTEDFRQPMSSSGSSGGSAPAPQPAPVHHSTVSSHPVTTSASSQPAAQPAAVPAAPVAAAPAPRPTISPRARLLARLHAMGKARPAVRGTDPVAQAFDYVANLSQLTR